MKNVLKMSSKSCDPPISLRITSPQRARACFRLARRGAANRRQAADLDDSYGETSPTFPGNNPKIASNFERKLQKSSRWSPRRQAPPVVAL
jgi:hypothetical protein